MESKGRDFRGTRHKGTTSATGRSTITGRSRQNGWNLDTLPPLPPFFLSFLRSGKRCDCRACSLSYFLFFFSSLYPFSRRLWLQRFFAILGVALLHPSSALGGPFSGFLFFCYWFSVLCRRLVLLLAPLRFSSPSPTPLRMPPSVRGAVLAFSRSHAHYGFLLRWHSSVFSQRKTSPARADKLLGFIVLCFSATCELFLFFFSFPPFTRSMFFVLDFYFSLSSCKRLF